MKEEATYNSFERNSYHFRKRLPHRHLLHYNKDTMYRISLRKVAKSFYHILVKDKNKLNQLTRYINRRVTVFLELQGKVTLDQISEFIFSICNEYRDEAIKENSNTEMKRVDALEYTNEFGVQAGHSIQAISKAYKEVVTQYNNLTTDIQKTYLLGSEIVKRSNITKEQLLQIPENKRLIFYEMIIKSEKYILEQDIKLYIKRNLYQFQNLITDFDEPEGQQVGKAYAKYLDILCTNKPQVNYLQFLKKLVKNDAPISEINREEVVSNILELLKTNQEDKLLNVSTNIENLIDQYIKFKKYKEKSEKRARSALSYFADFLRGNGKEYETKELSDLTIKSFLDFQDLLVNCSPKNKKTANLTLFDMIERRLENNFARYSVNSMSGLQGIIKPFWKYLTKYHKNLNLDIDIIDSFNPAALLAELKEDNSEQDASIRAFTMQEINIFMENAYDEKELRKTLLRSPRNFYVFIFSFLTGTRLEESLLISMNDIKVQMKNEKKYFYIHLKDDEVYQHLKNRNAHRNIPITDIMIDLGLLNYINRRHLTNQKTLFDFPDSASASISIYYRRYFQKLFPDATDTRANRNSRMQKNFIHFRSLRKNYADFLFKETRTEFDTEANKRRLMGHSNGITGVYLGRLEPFIGYTILNAITYDEINFKRLFNFIRNYWVTILYDLEWLYELDKEDWNRVSTVRTKRGRKV